MSLTDRGIKQLQPSLKRLALADCKGLFLDVTLSGSMSWFYRYSLNGRPEKVILGPYPEISLKRPREKRNEYAVQVAEGKSPAEEKRKAKIADTANSTFREFGERYYRDQVEKNWKNRATNGETWRSTSTQPSATAS